LQDVKESTAAVREATLSTTKQLPAIAASVRASVDRAADAMQDMKAATGRLPGVVDSLQGAVDNVKAITEDVQPLLRSVEGTLEGVDEIVTGAQQTWPTSTYAAKGRAARVEERIAPVPRSLRRDDLVRE
jgi:ABC-type transporter Mla subunit MlaD